MEESHLEIVTDVFHQSFAGAPRIFRAPGRVNLIGEHTDYNDGFVMPFAIDRETLTAGVARSDGMVNVLALDINERAAIDLALPPVRLRGTWLDYVEGTTRKLQEKFGLSTGADLVFSSTVPIGAGLSSSAALETSIGYALLALADMSIDRKGLAFASQAAEHDFAGIRSGIMDQFTSVFGRAGHAMLLDCRSLDVEQIPLAMEGTMIAVCDTGVKHQLASSEYNRRRAQCETGVRLLAEKMPGLKSLRDVSSEDLVQFGPVLPETIARRCRHVVTENERTLNAAAAIKRGNAREAGRLMYESHRSLRDDYQVSCAELDLLVDAASGAEGVYGARMTGGGFGGCTVNLIRTDAFDDFRKEVEAFYGQRFGFAPKVYTFQAADGASEAAM